MGFAGPKTYDEIIKSQKPIRMGATRAGNTTQLPEMLNRWAGGKFEVIPGYTGTSKIRLAMRSHEVDGACWTGIPCGPPPARCSTPTAATR